jgi:hydrogenase maturation protease
MSRMVIGVGNPTRGDDGAGPETARRLDPPGVIVSAPFELMDLWGRADEVVIVDAARSGAPPGTIHRFDVGQGALPTGLLSASTHSLGVADVVELARALGQLPSHVLVYGIEAGDVSHGDVLSPEVEAAVSILVSEVEHA